MSKEHKFQFPRICLANARSFNNKKDEKECEVKRLNADIIAIITETWLNDENYSDCINISGYNLLCEGRSDFCNSGIPYLERWISLEEDRFVTL